MENKIVKILLILSLLIILTSFISAISIVDVSSNPNEVSPGNNVEVRIKIENTNNYDVKNVNVKLNLENVPFAPYQSSSEDFIDEINKDDEEIFVFNLVVLPSTASGIYKIPFEIKYEDHLNTTLTKTGLISVIVNSKPYLTASLEDSIILIKGKENQVSIKIVNSGLADVKFLYVNAMDVSGLKFLSEKEQYLGDVGSDDFDSVEYKVYIKESSSSTIVLPVTLTYRDSTNREFTETKEVSLRVYSLKEAETLGLVKKPSYLIYFLIPILIIGYVIYKIRKKRKLNKKISK